MTNTTDGTNDPLSFMRNLWSNMGGNAGGGMGGMGFGLPGMMTPTFDVEELEKRINDMKAVEGWLRMNLSMLQMTIQGMEMQKATLTVVQAMGDMANKVGEAPTPTPTPEPPPPPPQAEASAETESMSQAAMWPWKMMQQVQEAMQTSATEAAQAESKAKGRGSKTKPK